MNARLYSFFFSYLFFNRKALLNGSAFFINILQLSKIVKNLLKYILTVV